MRNGGRRSVRSFIAPGFAMSDLDRCYAAALKILGYRFNSIHELRRKLAAKAFSPDEIADTVRRLVEENWLDDERYAGALVRVRARKRVGRLRIRRELRQAGVAEETADAAVSENIAPDDERVQLGALCAKKIRLLSNRHGVAFVATEQGRNKLTAYLLRQGYDIALVIEVIREQLKNR
jgi:SOS response regulatory protein OraA/RecX